MLKLFLTIFNLLSTLNRFI